jgi:hypothetical protein
MMAIGLLTISHAQRVRATDPSPQAARASGPRYDADGMLFRPQDFESWVFVGASTGLSYQKFTSSGRASNFHNVYILPEAYQAYRRTGKFPEKTMLALAIYRPSEKVSPAKGGYFEGDFEALEVAVKDHEKFSEGWSYYSFSEDGQQLPRARAFPKEMCYSCHVTHGAEDNVFVQFYPVLRQLKATR